MRAPSGTMSPSRNATGPLIDGPGASLWAFARATGVAYKDAEVALRAAYADAWPGAPVSASDRAALLVALGRAIATLREGDRLPVAASPFARAFQSLQWPVQVTLWGHAIDGLPLGDIIDALGGDADRARDPARQLLLPYLNELAGSSRPECAAALRRAARRTGSAALGEVGELDPHIATCRSCQTAFPLRVGAELGSLAPTGTPLPPALARQIEIDHARTAAGLALTIESPTRRRPAAAFLTLTTVAVLVAIFGTLALGSHMNKRASGPSSTTIGLAPAPGAGAQEGAPRTPPLAASAVPKSPAPLAGPPSTTASPPVLSADNADNAFTRNQFRVPVRDRGASAAPPTPAPPLANAAAPGSPAPPPPAADLPLPIGPATPTTTAAAPPPPPYVPPPTTSAPSTTTPPTTSAPSTTAAPPTTTTPPTTSAPSTTTAPTTTSAPSTTSAPPTTSTPSTTAAPTPTTTTTAPAFSPVVLAPLALVVLPGLGALRLRRRTRGRSVRP